MLKIKIKYYLFALTIVFCHLTLFAQNKNIDSLLTLIKTSKPDTNKAIYLSQLTYECLATGDYEKGLNYGTEALKLANKLNFKKGITNVSSNIANIYCSQANYPQALDYYLKTLKLHEELKNKNGIATVHANIGIVYSLQGDYKKALDYYFKALKMAEELGNKNLIGNLLGQIGIVYNRQGDYQKALDYYFKALKIKEEIGNKVGTSSTLGNIGNAFKDQKDFTKALDYYFKALKMKEDLGDKRGMAINLGNIGSLYTTTGKFKQAEHYLKRAIAMDDSTGTLDMLRQDYEYLSLLYDTTGRHKEALIFYKKAITLKDTIFSQENKKELVRKEMNFEFDKKEIAAKAQQDKKDAVTASEKQRQKVVIYSVSIGLFLVLLLALFIFKGYKQKQKANIVITQQKAEVEKQKELVEIKNKEITDSINYAKRIQQAKLPKKEEIYSALPQSFVLFKPKDIVSGDFYFFHKNESSVFIASADCTGHGVPGAFMSMIGSEKLSDAVSQSTDTSEILKQLNKGIKTSLHQSENDESTRDGMDIALCSVDTENRIVKYAGANRPIWIIRKGQTEVVETKATKKAIAGFTEDDQYFDTHELKLQQGDTFYIFTDGYADQFGGEDGKKLMTKKFKEILLDIQGKTMQEQEKHLDTFVDNWRGNREQIDDILVIGVRL
ncbi:MAG: tetratricopeptide repeat protein [Bacteroidia bacterium]|nr:tetratricopeptide repeat protein [Bacteroidia bacterium]